MGEQLSLKLGVGKPRLTAARAREVLDYDADTGKLTWRVNRGQRVKAGSEAGSVFTRHRTRYRRVRIDGVPYLAHRLAFLIYYGAMPTGDIDHIDHDGLNNTIFNLRAVPRTMNLRNQRKRCTNTSGVMGVCWRSEYGKWHAQIMVSRRNIYLGLFTSLADATAVRKRAERLHDYHPNHGRESTEEITHV